jgi:hypothetical protein
MHGVGINSGCGRSTSGGSLLPQTQRHFAVATSNMTEDQVYGPQSRQPTSLDATRRNASASADPRKRLRVTLTPESSCSVTMTYGFTDSHGCPRRPSFRLISLTIRPPPSPLKRLEGFDHSDDIWCGPSTGRSLEGRRLDPSLGLGRSQQTEWRVPAGQSMLCSASCLLAQAGGCRYTAVHGRSP